MKNLKCFEHDLKNNKDLQQKLESVFNRIAEEGKAANDGEIMVLAAKELGYEITVAELEQSKAEAEELDRSELTSVAGGFMEELKEMGKGENDTWCLLAWHCYTTYLHTPSEDKNAACWSDYSCMKFSKKD